MLQGARLALWKHRGTWDPDSGPFQVRYDTGGGTASAKGGLGSALRGGAALHPSQLQGEEEGTEEEGHAGSPGALTYLVCLLSPQ